MLEKDGAVWVRTVKRQDLESLGGDTNRLYQLLVDGKGAAVISLDQAIAVLNAASKRCDLFSAKQCEVIAKHKEELEGESLSKANEATEKAKLLAEQAEEEKKRKNLEALYEAERKAQELVLSGNQAMANGSVYRPTIAATQNVHDPYTITNKSDVQRALLEKKMGAPSSSVPVASQKSLSRPESPSYAPSEALRAFVDKHKRCIKGSPDEFRSWLWILGIMTLDDLATAVLNDDYLRDVLQQGNGKVGVKGCKRDKFKKAVMAAALDETAIPDELLCPISHVLMSNDPVVAADGQTYERAAIEAWIHKQTSEVAIVQESFGRHSQQARDMVERGVLSPMTNMRMSHLNLTPNHVVRSLARDFASH